jgi:hypothetical protein
VLVNQLLELAMAAGAAFAGARAAPELAEVANSQRHDRGDDFPFRDLEATARVLAWAGFTGGHVADSFHGCISIREPSNGD